MPSIATISRHRRWQLLAVLLVITILASTVIGPTIAGLARAGHGLLRVETSPNVPSAIVINGETRNTAAVQGLELPAGEHVLAFTGVDGYLPPPPATITIAEGELLEVVGTFTAAGSIEVTTKPDGLEPVILVDGIERDRGSTSLLLETGPAKICAEPVSGFETPSCQIPDIQHNKTSAIELTFVPSSDPAPEDGSSRVSEGLVSLYDFAEGSGSTVTDAVNGLDLNIADTSAVTWTSDGLRFDRGTIARTSTAPKALYDAVGTSQEFTVEAWVTPSALDQTGPARIVTLAKDTTAQNFVLGQGGSQGTSGERIQYRSHERSGDWQLLSPTGSLTTELTHVAVTRAGDGTVKIYLDGQLEAQQKMATTLNWNTSYLLGIGQEHNGERPWLGTYHLTAIYNTALDTTDITTNYQAGPNGTSDIPQSTKPDPEPEPEPGTEPAPGPAPEPSPGAKASSLKQHGITWTFDKEYPVGQYANGDYWVVGPVRITSIDPKSVSGDRVMHGSMINPSPLQGSIGYGHVRMNNYKDELNVALNVSSQQPLTVQPASSLVSTISVPEENARPGIDVAAVLTVVDGPPPVGTFRPAYSGNDKSPRYNVQDLRTQLLPRLAPVAGSPSIDVVAGHFEKVWLDHKAGWTGRKIHPKQNMPDYGRDMAARLGEGSLMLMLDYPQADKQRLLINYVQVGIDFHGIIEAGGTNHWYADGGHSQGRKWPIMFAGTLLGDQAMADIGNRKVSFGEDQQTFYVTQADVDRGNGYTSSDIGMPEYGVRHANDPSRDDASWGAPYRTCCTANSWHGHVLSARIMGLQNDWNHPALFDYTDRYMKREEPGSWTRSWNRPFSERMWDSYRPQF